MANGVGRWCAERVINVWPPVRHVGTWPITKSPDPYTHETWIKCFLEPYRWGHPPLRGMRLWRHGTRSAHPNTPRLHPLPRKRQPGCQNGAHSNWTPQFINSPLPRFSLCHKFFLKKKNLNFYFPFQGNERQPCENKAINDKTFFRDQHASIVCSRDRYPRNMVFIRRHCWF